MSSVFKGLVLILLALFILNGIRYLKYPPSDDPFYEVAHAADSLRPYLPHGRLISIRSYHVPEDYMLYMRYHLIPERANFTLRATSPNIIVISSAEKIGAVTDSLLLHFSATRVRQISGDSLGFSLLSLP